MAAGPAAAGAGAGAAAGSPVLRGESPLQRSMSPATTNNNTQQQVNEQSWHRFLWLPLVFLVPASVVSVGYITDMVKERQAHMSDPANAGKFDWSYPQLSDLQVTLVGLVVLLTLRCTLCPYVFTPLGNWFLPSIAEKKGKWSEAARADRVQRFSVCLFKLCFFLVMTCVGYDTLKDQDWLPPQLGGSGSVSNAWNGWPYSAVTASVKRYYLLELSYHAHSLVFHLMSMHRNDFVEMTLHHTCAVLLVVFSYFANWVRMGSLVLFLHDIADVMAYAVKAVVDSRYTKVTLSCYAGLLITWGYTRLFVFPFYVIPGTVIPGSGYGSFAWITSFAMIWTLQLLHVYWYVLFLIMGYRFAISGKTVDIQQKAGESDGSYKDYHLSKEGEDEQSTAPGRPEEQNGQPRQRARGGKANGTEAAQVQEPDSPPVKLSAPPRTRSQKKSQRAE